MTKELKEDITRLLERKWSPETISGYMKRQGRECVSAEWIYHLVRQDKAEGGVLYKSLPHSLRHRRRPVSRPVSIRNRVSIDERPAIVSLKARFGDWEMDTIVGPGGKGVIVTLVERLTKKMLMSYCPKGKDSKALARIVVALLLPYRDHVHTITTDNGSEFADHQYIAKRLRCKVYFAHPYSSWEKGLIENTNKLIRQFIPKRTVLSSLSSDFISHVQAEINLRPRKFLNFDTPNHNFMLYLHNPVALGC
jgi:IS30 family transposase